MDHGVWWNKGVSGLGVMLAVTKLAVPIVAPARALRGAANAWIKQFQGSRLL